MATNLAIPILAEGGWSALTRTLSARSGEEAPAVAALAIAILPQSWVEAVYDGIWLTIVQAGRWDDQIAATVARIHERERDLVRQLLDPSGQHATGDLEPQVGLTLALVHGLRAARVPPREGLTADRVAEVLGALGPAG